MNNPKVSIIIPCYNQAQFLHEALQSVLDQTYANWECIIVDDGSPDHAEEIAKKWVNSDLRFVYFKKENGGLSSARNLGLDNAKGEFIQFLDSDDILDNKKLELSIKELHLNRSLNIIISNFRMFTIDHNYSTAAYCTLDFEFFNFKSILLKWESIFSIPIHCGLFGANLFQDFRFPEELKAKEDWIMWLSLFQKEFKVSFINTPLAYYRMHKKSMTNDAKYMLENHMKAIIHIRNIISEKDYLDYLYLELQQKYNENIKLRSTIYNYQNSLTYKLAEKIKATLMSKYFLKIIKK